MPERHQSGGTSGSDGPIPEGEGGFPWWIWVAILLVLIYAFTIGPFNLTSPGG